MADFASKRIIFGSIFSPSLQNGRGKMFWKIAACIKSLVSSTERAYSINMRTIEIVQFLHQDIVQYRLNEPDNSLRRPVVPEIIYLHSHNEATYTTKNK